MKRSVIQSLMVLVVMVSGCNKFGSKKNDSSPDNSTPVTPKFTLAVYEMNGGVRAAAPLYRDTDASSSFVMTTGVQYDAEIALLDPSDHRALSFNVSVNDISDFSPPAPQALNFKVGTNLFTAPAPADYELAFQPVDGGNPSYSFPIRAFQSSVICNNPQPLDATKLDMSKLVVSTVGDNEVTYNAAGVVGNVGGMPPYKCAYNVNGDYLSRDTLFDDCGKTITAYENYMGIRNIGVIVRDACNTTVSASANRTIAPAPNRTPGDNSVFIHGQIVAGDTSGAAASHPSFIYPSGVGVNYWATNNSLAKPVQPNMRLDGANSSFEITSDMFTYGMPSSVTFGMRIAMGNINASLSANFDSSGNAIDNSHFDLSHAQITEMSYSTDQAGDSHPQLLVSGISGCTLTNPGLEVLQVVGTPCAPGSTNSNFNNNQVTWTIHGWGTYDCPQLVGPGSSVVHIMGSFDGATKIVDGCVGGGQDGGGGVDPWHG